MIDKGKKVETNMASNNSTKKDKRFSQTYHAARAEDISNKCGYCGEQHQIYKCEKFLKPSVDSRNEEVRKHGLCLNCLKRGHLVKDCKLSSCRKCGSKHNSLIHKDRAPPTKPKKEEESKTAKLVGYCGQSDDPYVLLSTAQVYVRDKDGKLNPKKCVNVTIGSRILNFTTEEECVILPVITAKLPQVYLPASQFTIPREVILANPDFRKPGEIYLLLGGGFY